jgi:hypothetical protein
MRDVKMICPSPTRFLKSAGEIGTHLRAKKELTVLPLPVPRRRDDKREISHS